MLVVSACDNQNNSLSYNDDSLEQDNNLISTSTDKIGSSSVEVVSSSSDEIDMNDWQTYKNEELGFEFKYPKEWKIKKEYQTLLVSKNEIEQYEIGSNNAPIRITRGKKGYFYNEKIFNGENFLNFFNLIKEENITIKNKVGKRIELYDKDGFYEGDSAGKIVIIIFDDFIIEGVERPGNTDLDYNFLEMFNICLNNFKFIE